jgi:hypothetical protein
MAMEVKSGEEKISSFKFEGQMQQLNFVETTKVKEGVECGVYAFVGDDSKDLGIVKIQPDAWTPPQEVLQGDRTIEGYISGKGKLVLVHKGGNREEYIVGESPTEKLSVDIKIGDIMQWQADKDSNLVVSEICLPPYADGRYRNLPDEKI